MSDEDKPFVCSQPGCGMKFTNEDHLSVHIRKHDFSLALNLTPGGLSPLGLFSDMTPTPTKFLKNCEEMGLFQELSKNPFDDSFKKAMDEPIDHNDTSFSVSEDEEDNCISIDSPSTALTGSSSDTNTDNNTELVPVSGFLNKSPVKETVQTKVTNSSNKTSIKPVTQSVSVAPVTTTVPPTGRNLVIPVVIQLPTGQLITVQVPASNVASTQVATTGGAASGLVQGVSGTMQISNGSAVQTQQATLNIAKSVIPNGNNVVVTQTGQLQNNIPLIVKSPPKPNNVQTTMLVNQPVLQTLVNQSGTQSVPQTATLNQSNTQTGLQVALQTLLNQTHTQNVMKTVNNQLVTQSPVRLAASQIGSQSTVTGIPSVLNISRLPGVLNQSNTPTALKQVILPNKQIGLIATSPQTKVSQTVQSTTTDMGNQSYAKQRLKAALQQQMTPSSGQKMIYQMIDVKKEPQTSPSVEGVGITSPAAVSSPESGFSPQGAQLYDNGMNNDMDSSDPESRRMKFLERNRAAAARCRQKRKRWVQELEQKADDLSSVNNKLCGEIKKLRGEVAHLKTMLLAHKDCPVTMQQRSQGQVNSVLFEEDDVTEIDLTDTTNAVTSADSSSLNHTLNIDTGASTTINAGGSMNRSQPNVSALPVGIIPNLGTADQLPVVMNPVSVITGPNSLAMIPKILNIDPSNIQSTSSNS
ncbi:Alcohol O-acetyltransferase [Mactra antiquata]